MKRFRFTLLLAVALVTPSAVVGQTAPAGTEAPGIFAHEDLNFIGGGPGIAGSDIDPRFLVGPYSGSFTRGSGSTASFSIYCVDVARTAQSSKVVTTSLRDGEFDASLTRLSGDTDALMKYRQAAYLASLFSSVTRSAANWTPIHVAIWQLIDPTGATSAFNSIDSGVQTAADEYLEDAEEFGVRGGNWYVMTPTDDDGNIIDDGQSWLVQVPEPSTYMLLGTGFLLMVGVSRKRFTEGQDAA